MSALGLEIEAGVDYSTSLSPSNAGESGTEIDGNQQLSVGTFANLHLLEIRGGMIHTEAVDDCELGRGERWCILEIIEKGAGLYP